MTYLNAFQPDLKLFKRGIAFGFPILIRNSKGYTLDSELTPARSGKKNTESSESKTAIAIMLLGLAMDTVGMKVDLGQNVRLVVSVWRFFVSSFRHVVSSFRYVVSSFRLVHSGML